MCILLQQTGINYSNTEELKNYYERSAIINSLNGTKLTDYPEYEEIVNLELNRLIDSGLYQHYEKLGKDVNEYLDKHWFISESYINGIGYILPRFMSITEIKDGTNMYYLWNELTGKVIDRIQSENKL